MTQAIAQQFDWPEPVIGLSLFGSRARGDEVAESDYDILVWCEGGNPRTMRSGLHALAIYPRAFLLEQARQGDLFTSHLVHEAKAIWDPDGMLAALRQAFRAKRSYQDEIARARAIGDFLLAFHPRLPSALINRRLAWVVRTILIAKSAEQGVPRFATSALVDQLDALEAADLIALKDKACFHPEGLIGLRSFLQKWAPTGLRQPATIEGFAQLFEWQGNEFGLQTLKSLKDPTLDADYR